MGSTYFGESTISILRRLHCQWKPQELPPVSDERAMANTEANSHCEVFLRNSRAQLDLETERNIGTYLGPYITFTD